MTSPLLAVVPLGGPATPWPLTPVLDVHGAPQLESDEAVLHREVALVRYETAPWQGAPGELQWYSPSPVYLTFTDRRCILVCGDHVARERTSTAIPDFLMSTDSLVAIGGALAIQGASRSAKNKKATGQARGSAMAGALPYECIEQVQVVPEDDAVPAPFGPVLAATHLLVTEGDAVHDVMIGLSGDLARVKDVAEWIVRWICRRWLAHPPDDVPSEARAQLISESSTPEGEVVQGCFVFEPPWAQQLDSWLAERRADATSVDPAALPPPPGAHLPPPPAAYLPPPPAASLPPPPSQHH